MKERFDVTGMTCASCQANVTRAVQNLGVKEVYVNLVSETMNVDYGDSGITQDDIINAIDKIGYGAIPKNRDKAKPYSDEIKKDHLNLKNRLIISFAFLLPLMYVSMGHMIGLPLPRFLHGTEGAVNYAFIQFLLTLPVLFVNRKFYESGFKGLINKAPNMDSLVALGSTAASLYGIFAIFRMAYGLGFNEIEVVEQYRHNLYFESSAMIFTLITLGKYFEARSKGETKASLENLINLAPKTATVIDNDIEKTVSVDDLKQGDIILVKPGESIAVDGIIIEGSSLIDESAITGESIPVQKQVGDNVISATINNQGSFKFRATKVGEDTTLAQIIELVNDANETKAPIARTADKISSIFVPTVIVLSIITFIVWIFMGYGFEFALNLAISILVISCPCALGLATPMAIMVSTGKSAEFGLLFKNAESLENLHKVDTILMDKTGTITEGKPVVTDVISQINEDEFIKISTSIENNSEHPLSNAIKEYAKEKGISSIKVDDFEAISGKGIKAVIENNTYYAGNLRLMEEENIDLLDYFDKADKFSEEGKTSMYFADSEKVIGIIAVQDRPKALSKVSISELKNLGYEVRMITGDNEKTAEAIRKDLEIDDKYAEVLPQDKEREVNNLQKEGKKVLMVGDGINDAPALARADVAMAIGNGTDIAIDSADVVLIKNNILDIVNAIELSQETIKIIKQNLFWAFFYNVLGIPLAAGVFYPITGWTLSPMFGAFAMSISSIFVCINSLRLRGFKPHYKSMQEIENINNNLKNELIKNTETKEKESMFGTKKAIVNVEGMSCNHCKAHVEEAINSVDGVKKAVVDLDKNIANVKFSGDLDKDAIKKSVEDAGYKVTEIVEE